MQEEYLMHNIATDELNKSQSERLAFWEKFNQAIINRGKPFIEKELEINLIWDRLDGKKASRIKYYISGLNFDDHSNYDELMNTIIDVAVKMREVFRKYINS